MFIKIINLSLDTLSTRPGPGPGPVQVADEADPGSVIIKTTWINFRPLCQCVSLGIYLPAVIDYKKLLKYSIKHYKRLQASKGMQDYSKLGKEPIDKLLLGMALSACTGMLTIMLYSTIDTIFIGHFVGSQGIAATTISYPVNMLLPTFGMAVGAGAGSLIARNLGKQNVQQARFVFGNAFTLALTLCLLFTGLCYLLKDRVLSAFGATDETLAMATSYYQITLIGIPFLGSWMSMNQMLRGEGLARLSMNSMLLSSLLNIVLDALFIAWFGMGIEGAALATVIAQIIGWGFSVSIYLRKQSALRMRVEYFIWKKPLLSETVALGSATFGRQASEAVLLILLNKVLLLHGGPMMLAAYGIITRMQALMMVPIIGLNQSFIPIAAYNYGAKRYDRVITAFIKAIVYGLVSSYALVVIVWAFPEFFVGWFTQEKDLIDVSANGLIFVIACLPFVVFQLVGTAYFQALGKSLSGLLMTVSRQMVLLIPLLLILPPVYGLDGVWLSFPLANGLIALFTVGLFIRILKALGRRQAAIPLHGS